MKPFSEIEPGEILSSVEAFGFRATGGIFQLNSMENRVYEVEVECENPRTPSDTKKIIKFYRPERWSKELILDEHRFLLDLHHAELPTLLPLATASGETLVETRSGIFCSVSPKFGGRHLDDPTPARMQQLGRLLARVHAIGKQRQAQRPVFTPQQVVPAALSTLHQCGLVPPEALQQLEQVSQQFLSIAPEWFDGVELQRIHGDCHRGNILWRDDLPHLVDFDDMVVGPVIQDLWLLLPGRGEQSKAAWDWLMEGYATFAEFPEETVRLIEPLRFMRLIRYAAWIAQRWHDPIFPKVFAHFAEGSYWRSLLGDLYDALRAMYGGGFFAFTEDSCN